MATIDEFSRLVSGIYAAVMTPEQWNVTLADIGRAFDGSRAALVITDGNTRMHTHADLPADTAQSYAEHYARLDYVLAEVETGPLGAVRTGAELMWPHQECEFQADWARPNGFVDGLFIRLTGAPSTMSLPWQRRSAPIGSTPQNMSRSCSVWSPICSRRCARRNAWKTSAIRATASPKPARQ